MIEDRSARIAALAEVLRPWDRNDPPIGDALVSWAGMLDFVYLAALAEARAKRPKQSGAARRRAIKARQQSVEASARGEDFDMRAGKALVLHWRDLAAAIGDPVPDLSLDRAPAKYAADRALDAALATFARLTGAAAARRNRQADTGRSHEPTVRSGPALAFARMLDGFYGVKLATDLRMAETISRLREVAQHRLTYGAQ